MTAETTEEVTTREVVYLGRRAGAKGKVVYAAQIDGTESYWAKRPYGLPTYAMPGQVYEVAFDTDGAYFIAGPRAPRFLRLFPDAEYRAGWEAADRAAGALIDAGRAAASDPGGIAELCQPLRRVYQRATPFARAALLVRIVAEIQKGADR